MRAHRLGPWLTRRGISNGLSSGSSGARLGHTRSDVICDSIVANGLDSGSNDAPYVHFGNCCQRPPYSYANASHGLANIIHGGHDLTTLNVRVAIAVHAAPAPARGRSPVRRPPDDHAFSGWHLQAQPPLRRRRHHDHVRDLSNPEVSSRRAP